MMKRDYCRGRGYSSLGHLYLINDLIKRSIIHGRSDNIVPLTGKCCSSSSTSIGVVMSFELVEGAEEANFR